jgi:quercetin dioxygenase-like cupin family protein
MLNKDYTDAVERKEYPDSQYVSLDVPFMDERGIIQNIVNTPINGVAIITSKAGSVRSNHYHKTDFHYLYVLSGSMEYYERGVDDYFRGAPLIVKVGEMVFTPPMKIHKTVFLEETVLLSMAKNFRDHNSHESDVVREIF